MSDSINQQRHDRAALEAEIRASGSQIKRDACHCPHPDHGDRRPSASIHAGSDGVWRVTCHSRACFGRGADVFDLRAALQGRPVDEVLREARGVTPGIPKREAGPDLEDMARQAYATMTDRQRQALGDELGLSVDALRRLRVGWLADRQCWTWPMRDADHSIIGIRTRETDGTKRAIRSSRNGLFIPADLPAGGTLYVVEGATDTAALLDMGLPAIGRPSNNAGEDAIADYVQRQQPEAVVIVSDRDGEARAAQATRDAADRLAKRLATIVGTVRIIQPPGQYKDVRQWRQAGAGQDDVEGLADQAESRGPAGELRQLLQAEADGTRRAIPWPWRLVSRGTQALLPGHVTLVCGDPGDGKTLWLLEALAYWHDQGIPVAIYELEQTRAYHLKRMLAQRVGASWLTDLEAVSARPDEVMALHSEHQGWLDAIGARMFEAPETPVNLQSLRQWVEARAFAGARVICIDPVTAANTSDRPWDDAQRFLQTVKPILDRHGASLVLVTHPKKTKQKDKPSTLDDLAGGAVWQRFAQSILWMVRHDEPKTVTVKNIGSAMPIAEQDRINRTLRIMKARDGKGASWQLGFDFDPQTLRFHERGAIVKQSEVNHT